MFGLDSIGKMFGGNLLGKLFDSVGMPWMNNVLSLATNVMTGNWLGAAKDVFDLVSQFSNNNSWMNRVSQFAPLGQFNAGGCFGDTSLSESRINDIRANTTSTTLPKAVNQTFTIAGYTIANNAAANRNLQSAHTFARV